MKKLVLFRNRISTLVTGAIIFLITVIIAVTAIGQIKRVDDLKTLADDKLGGAIEEGVSFLLVCENPAADSHNFYALVDYSLEDGVTTAVIPWQTTAKSGFGKKNLDEIAEKGEDDLLKAVNKVYETDIRECVTLNATELAQLAGKVSTVGNQQTKTVNAYASLVKTGEKIDSADLFNEDYFNTVTGYSKQGEVFEKLLADNLTDISGNCIQKLMKASVEETNTMAYAKLEKSTKNSKLAYKAITPAGTIKGETFKPADSFVNQIQNAF